MEKSVLFVMGNVSLRVVGIIPYDRNVLMSLAVHHSPELWAGDIVPDVHLCGVRSYVRRRATNRSTRSILVEDLEHALRFYPTHHNRDCSRQGVIASFNMQVGQKSLCQVG